MLAGSLSPAEMWKLRNMCKELSDTEDMESVIWLFLATYDKMQKERNDEYYIERSQDLLGSQTKLFLIPSLSRWQKNYPTEKRPEAFIT